MRMRLLALSFLTLTASAQYTPYWSGVPNVSSTSFWQKNGDVGNNAVSYLYGIAPTNTGSVISKVAVPDGTSDYQVDAYLTTNSGSNQRATIYLRASQDSHLENNQGTFYAVSLSRVDPASPFTLTVYKRQGGVLTTLLSSETLLWTAYPFKASITSHGPNPGIFIRVNSLSWFVSDTSITSGQPGIGLNSGYVSVGTVSLGPADRIAPNPVTGLSVSSFAQHTELQWTAATDNTNGVGVWSYEVYRNGVYQKTVKDTRYYDIELTPSTTYNYSIYTIDAHNNKGSAATISATTSSFIQSKDPRRTGVQPNGTYWGALGEQLDMLSGNLNYSLPLLSVRGRNGITIPFAISYNSQLWRKDVGGNWKLGADVGYGFGWKFLAGSIIPVNGGQGVAYYLFTDSSGAEYKLDVKTGTVWSSTQSIYVWYDESTQKLYFSNGTFWKMDCTSAAGIEQDGGTRYPTLIQDSNNNQIVIRYMPAIGSLTANTSARIDEIEDVRATDQGSGVYRTYKFAYNTDPIPHLIGITNTINTSEAYTFAYSTAQALDSPFSPPQSFGTAQRLQSVTINGLNLSHQFEYNGSAEMTRLVLPYLGEFQWVHSTFTFAESRSIREVTSRKMKMSTSGTLYTYPVTRNPADSSLYHHSNSLLDDASGNGQRYWTFSTVADFRDGMNLIYEERNMPGSVVKSRSTYTWSMTGVGDLYVSEVLNALDPGQAYAKTSKTTQALDIYGNMTEQKMYEFDSLSTPARITACTFTSYPSRYIFRLLMGCTKTGNGQSINSGTISYDAGQLTYYSPYPRLWDSNAQGQRGNPTSFVTAYSSLGVTYDMLGGAVRQQDNIGHLMEVQFDQLRSYAAPSVITPNSNSNLNSTMSWNGFLGLTSQTRANTYAVSFSYDGYARPATSSTRDGRNWTYTYTTSPPTKTASSPADAFGNMWTKDSYDGFGRLIRNERGYSSTILSIADTEFQPCACSPVGKLYRTSLPYKTGQTVYWTTYNYDGLGRTTSVALPGGAGTTTYSYQGNTVTVTDPSGRWKKMTMDAFGNLIQVNEPNPAGGADLVTTYAYNLNNKLTQVSMQRGSITQLRTFVYDTQTQTRLISETLPEAGTTVYTYYADGTLASRTDSRNLRIEYSYDSYGRITNIRRGTWNGVTFSPDLTKGTNFSYDAPMTGGGTAYGSLAGYTQGNGVGESYEYTNRGRLSKKTLNIPQLGGLAATFNWGIDGQIQRISYPRTALYNATTYDPSDSTAALQYQENVYISYAFDTNGRPFGATAGNTWAVSGGTTGLVSQPIASNAQYNEGNALTSLGLIGMTETRQYNVLNQLVRITRGAEIDVEYKYSATGNNGRITSQKNWLSGEEVTYQYDSLSRLSQAATVGPQWGQSFSYDGFGNLLAKNITKGTATSMSVIVDGTTNRLTGANIAYDAVGNMTMMPYSSGAQTMTYDHDNRLTSITNSNGTESYLYTGSGHRITKTKNGQTTVFFYGLIGELLGIYRPKTYNLPASSGTTNGFECIEEHFYFSGRRIATRLGSTPWGQGNPAAATRYSPLDRISSTGDGFSFFPYGDEKTPTTNDKHKFATYYRDSQSGLDYAMNRYYSSVHGRFTSSDPFVASSAPNNPGSWNRYAYTEGDPVNNTDPNGLYVCSAEHSWCDPSNTPWLQYAFEAMHEGNGICGQAYLQIGLGVLQTSDARVLFPSCNWVGMDFAVAFLPQAAQRPSVLTCIFDSVSEGEPGFGYVNGKPETEGFYVPMKFTFRSSGGTDTLSWSNIQEVSRSGGVLYERRPVSMVAKFNEKLENVENPTSSTATFFDSPGLAGVHPGFGRVVGANVTTNFVLKASVKSGAQTADCPIIKWSITLKWTKAGPSISVSVIKP